MTQLIAEVGEGGERGKAPSWLSIAVAATSIWLGWQIVLGPISQRTAPPFAVRLNGGSSLVLRRAAEAEQLAGRHQNAGVLGRAALARSPFDVRALRVVGLVEDQEGRNDQADHLLTLAGNWSLRDDPTHMWLINQRLRQGNFLSAFGHADTLARRGQRTEDVYRLFTTAGVQYPDSASALARVLELTPPWRGDYLRSLYRMGAEEGRLATRLAMILEQSGQPLTDQELSYLYGWYLAKTTPTALAEVRARLGRPTANPAIVVDGDFDQSTGVEPFNWQIQQVPGATVDISAGVPSSRGKALRVAYEGFGATGLVQQLLVLPAGRVSLMGLVLDETPNASEDLAWHLYCRFGNRVIKPNAVNYSPPGDDGWRQFSQTFVIPSGCDGQWLRLDVPVANQRVSATLWFDDLVISQQ
jgi:hypothetical protein